MKGLSKRYSLAFVFIQFVFTATLSATPAQIVARTGQSAAGISEYTYNGLFRDNASQPASLPAPKMAGDLVTLFASLRQGTSVPVTDRGVWLLHQNGQGRVVARRGMQAIGAAPGTNYQLLTSVNTDSFGRVFLISSLEGADVDPAINYRGLWSSDMDHTELVVREGQPAPGTIPQAHFFSLSEGTGLDGSAGMDVLVNSYIHSLPGAQIPVPLTTGMWARTDTGLQMLSWSYGTVPGVLNAGLLEAHPVISASGRGVFSALLGGLGIVSVEVNGVIVANDRGVWRVDENGNRILVARSAERAPGTPEGVVFRTLPSGTARAAVNASGEVVFWGMLAGPGVNSGNWTGLWRANESGVTLLARGGSPASAIGSGVVFGGIYATSSENTLWVMPNGDAVFATGLGGSGITLANCTAIWKRSLAGIDTVIAQAGVPNSALPEGTSIIRTMLPIKMKAAGEDHVMFTSRISGTGVTTTNDEVLLRHRQASGLQLVAREGQVVGDHILKSFVNDGADLQLTGNGYAVVSVTLVPVSNPNATPQLGIMGISPSGMVQILAAKNSPIQLSDGTSPVIADLRIALTSALNDNGEVALAALFNTSPRDEAVLVGSIDWNQRCPGDFNQSGTLDVQDIFAFLSAWFAQNMSADFDASGSITIPDIFAFLTVWFGGC